MRFRLRSLLIAVAVIALVSGFFAWATRWPSIRIAGGAVAQRQEVTISTSAEYPDALSVYVDGYIDGTAMLETDNGLKRTIGPGRVRERIGGDYYDQTCTILYEPEDVTKGELVIRYEFHGY